MEMMSTLVVVKDMETSKRFYTELMGMHVVQDLGANVTLDNRLSLQTLETWVGFLDMEQSVVQFGGFQSELYFEEEDFDGFLEKLTRDWPSLKLAQPVKTYPWGQRVVRFRDPDEHLVEVGHSMKSVVKGFLLEGMSLEEAQQKCMFEMEFVVMCQKELEQEGRL